tara:strand:- start:300 stop:1055 length:756 start_codon:yes stop_codon:yes gene_type:complete
MNYKILLIIFVFILTSCSIETSAIKKDKLLGKSAFKNNGFTLVYSETLYKKKIISSKLDDRDMVIFQKNLKKNSTVKIKNNKNNKSVIATVGKKADYPNFNNSVVTKRIASAIELDLNEPYVEITEIINKSSFVAKKAKTFEEEKKVANKAPVESITINDLTTSNKKTEIKNDEKFSYIIKIADFYFKDSANLLVKRITNETPIKKINLERLSDTNYRVFLGPFDNLNSLKSSFNDISMLKFENIEIIKND